MSEYAAFPALLFLALHPPQRITQSLLSCSGLASAGGVSANELLNFRVPAR